MSQQRSCPSRRCNLVSIARMNGLHRKVLNQIVREAGSDKSNARVHNKAREVCGQSKLAYLGRRVLSSY